MNRHAIEHIVDSPYCFPVSSSEIVLRLRTAKDDMKNVQVLYESKYVIGLTHKSIAMEKCATTELYDFYQVRLTLKDTRLAYVFLVNDGTGEYYFSEDGITKDYDFTLGYYNFFQYPYINETDIMPCVEWMKTAVFYQIFVDRFCMGNKDKDISYINCKWGDIPTPKTFAGGDLRGIIKHLDDIVELGCNAIYLTPVFRSPSNHKYDIIDYYQVDAQFGTNADLKELVDTAHQKGIRIVLDAVFNHCSDRSAQFQDVLQKGSRSRYYHWFVINGEQIHPERDNYETFASCTYMPKLNTSNSEVAEYLIGVGTHYVKEYGIDGWRLDVSDEVSHSFWRQFRQAIKAANPQAVIIGENWHDASHYLRGDQYDSIMNYAFTKLCLDFFAVKNKNAKQAAWKLNELLMRNTDTVNTMMLNLLDSHDTHRFYEEIGENRFLMKAALCMLYFYTGVPCIFYGTELLISGGYDPDCRRCMDWERVGENGDCADIRHLLQKLAQLRKQARLADGIMRIYADGGLLIMENTNNERRLRLVINLTDKEEQLVLERFAPSSFQISWNGEVIIDEKTK